jgi:GTP-binding protein HflX
MAAEVRGQEGLLTVNDSLEELAQLAHTAGLEVVGRDTQRLSAINASTYIGSGKVQELHALRSELEYDLLIFDDELSPAQLRNLEKQLEVRVLDRTALILDIFALHARTREGALQIELAQYAYRMPRLTRQWTHLSRQGVGGVGLRGPGETQLEVDRREIGRRMAHLREELEQVRRQRGLHRQRRRRSGIPVAAIVGYTNAGKSTLLNCLTDAGVVAEDKLFATLDPTTRKVNLPGGKELLFTDTVGFIQKLPTQLVASFRATLEEVAEADILVHVVDVSDPNLRVKVEEVDRILDEIEAGGKPSILVLNKADLVDPESELGIDRVANRFASRRSLLEDWANYARVVLVSAQQGVGIEDLLSAVEEVLVATMQPVELTIPYSAGELIDLWHTRGIVEAQNYTPKGVVIRGLLPPWLVGMIKAQVEQAQRSQSAPE